MESHARVDAYQILFVGPQPSSVMKRPPAQPCVTQQRKCVSVRTRASISAPPLRLCLYTATTGFHPPLPSCAAPHERAFLCFLPSCGFRIPRHPNTKTYYLLRAIIHTNTRACIHTSNNILLFTCLHAHIHTYVNRTCTHMQTDFQTHVQTHIQAHFESRIHASIQT